MSDPFRKSWFESRSPPSCSGGGGGGFSNPATGFIGPSGEAAMKSIADEQNMTSFMWNNLFLGQLMPLIFGFQPNSGFDIGNAPSVISGVFGTGFTGQGGTGAAGQPMGPGQGISGQFGPGAPGFTGGPGGIGGTGVSVPGLPGGPDVNLSGLGGLGPSAGIVGQTQGTSGINTTPAAGSPILDILQQGFDPQHALYAREVEQLQQQTESQLAQQGLGMSPYGAQVMGNVLGNFNIDWANQLLNREGTALSDVLNAYASAAQTGTTMAQPTEVAGQTAADIFKTASQAQSDVNATNEASQAASKQSGISALSAGASALGGIGK